MTSRVLPLAVLVLATLAAPAGAAEIDTDRKAILLLIGGPVGQPASTLVASAARAALVADQPIRITVETEHVDLARFNLTDEENHLREILRLKHARSFDAILSVGPEALHFLLRSRDSLWPGVPVVACDVEERTVAGLRLLPGMHAVTIRFDFEGTLQAALDLLPGTRRVALIGGAHARDQRNNDRARQAVAAYRDWLDLIDLTGLPIETMLARLATLPEDTIVLSSSVLADSSGRRFFGAESKQPVSEGSRGPVFTVFGTQIGGGTVGGSVVAYEQMGQEVGALTLRLLRGGPMPEGPVRSLASSVPIFDWRQLRRWHLDESRLPVGSRVLYRSPTLWAQYRWHVAVAVALLAAQSALIAGLLFERQRRRRAQADLAERLRFEMLLSEVSTLIGSQAVVGFDEHIQNALRRIGTFLGVDRVTLWEVSPSTRSLVPAHTWTASGTEGPPSVLMLEAFPFLRRLWEAGDVYSLSSLDELPAEADCDRRGLEKIGVQSLIVVPLSLGRHMLGALMCVTVREPRTWPRDMVRRLQMLAEPFAGVLARQQAATALETSEAFTRAVLAAPPGETAIIDGDGRIVRVNEAWAVATLPLTAVPMGVSYLDTCRVLIADGDPNASSIVTLVTSVLDGQQREGALEYPLRQAGEDRWFEIRVRRLQQPAAGAAITHLEITARKRAEARAKRHLDEMAHMDRVAAMGELASSFAHELNQPLAAILTNAQAAERFLALAPPDLAELRACLHDIIEDDRRAGEVIHRVRRLLRKEPAELEPVDLNDLARNVVALISNDALLRNVTIELRPALALPAALGDPVQLQQVMLNLLANGITAAANGAGTARKVTMWTAAHDGHVEFGVHDSGKGIAEDLLSRLFEPFFTTKSDGLGMGLTISRSIVEAHGGEISAENHPRGGATFRVWLPSRRVAA
ncbi:MAG TPA: ATP-binding protein [Methylomirabilota bacterium]|nr:ATP-binding protein [Methylomirabilota bacterium]